MMPSRWLPAIGLATVALSFASAAAFAQSATTTRLLLLEATGKQPPSAADVNLLRVSARSGSADTARVALRLLGQMERPANISDLIIGLRHSLPEIRIEAANAIAQAAQGLKNAAPVAGVTPASILGTAQTALIGRLDVEAEPAVRGAICEALARLPYRNADDAGRSERAILALAQRSNAIADRLGVAKALEFLTRAQPPLRAPGADMLAQLKQLARADSVAPGLDLARDARVRRLAVEGLISANALDAEAITRAAEDGDAQVRRLAMRAIAGTGQALNKAADGLVDPSPLVRIDALRALQARSASTVCAAAVKAAADADMNVALVAMDLLAGCGSSVDAVELLARTAADTDDIAVVRGWHRQAHAIVALATVAPDKAAPLLPIYVGAGIWQVRAYAARAAAQMNERAVLATLSKDPEDRVADVALAALNQPRRRRPADKPSELPDATAAELRRLAAPRARIVIRDVGTIDIALFTTEAPGTVLRFVRLAATGYYNGLSFDRLSPNAIVQGGAKGSASAEFPAREIGTWPHVRGTVGVSAQDGNDAQFFINLVDNPRFDHQLTVFAQVLNGADVVDQLLEGDVIESITIIP